jgi:hypothetical protein
MDFIAITITNLIWILYSMSEGLREGFFEHIKSKNKRSSEFCAKKIFNIQRFLVLLTTGTLLTYTIGWVSIPFIIAQIFMFKYFHRIIFEQTIKKLDKNSITETHVHLPPSEQDKKKTPMVLFGVSLQVFIYIFLI